MSEEIKIAAFLFVVYTKKGDRAKKMREVLERLKYILGYNNMVCGKIMNTIKIDGKKENMA